MDFDYTNRAALVTGAASGIGRETALALARSGARVAVADIDQAGAAATAAAIVAAGGHALPLQADVSVAAAAAQLVVDTVAAFGRLDFAVNGAGIEGEMAAAAELDPLLWQRIFDVNVHGVFYCMRAQLPQMVAQGGGVIVNIASIAGLNGFAYHAAYAASKHAVVGLTRSAALEYVRHGVRINAICPGFTDTPMVQHAAAADPERTARLFAAIPIRRLGTVAEIAAGILYLCSDSAAFMIGQTLVLDGGISAQ